MVFLPAAPCRGMWLTLNPGCRPGFDLVSLRRATHVAPKHGAPADARVQVLALQKRARLSGQLTSTVAVHDHGGGVSLADYMQLPVEQYNELDPDMITSLGDSRFRLIVPRLTLLSAWLQPVVTVRVASVSQPGSHPRVVLRAEHCSLHCSQLVERMQLDRRFTLHFTTELTWTPGEDPPGSSSSGGGAIHGALNLVVLTEVIPPFDLLPRAALEGTCNTALRGLMRTLLPIFLRQLAADYHRWSTQPDYRARRAAAAAGGRGLVPPA